MPEIKTKHKAPAQTHRPHELQVGSILVVQKNETEKRNPNSIRFLIGYVLNCYFEGNLTEAVRELSKHGGRYQDYRSDRKPKKLNTKAIKKILLDDEHIYYWQLEIFSRFLGIPTSIFLLLSRVFASARNNADKEVVGALLLGVRNLNGILTTFEWSKPDQEQLKKLTECFKDFSEEENRSPSLFLPKK